MVREQTNPSDKAILERASTLANDAMFSIALQRRRLRSNEPEDDVFVMRWWADLQFFIVALRRLRRAAELARRVPSIANSISSALKTFDTALPSLFTMRNVGEPSSHLPPHLSAFLHPSNGASQSQRISQRFWDLQKSHARNS